MIIVIAEFSDMHQSIDIEPVKRHENAEVRDAADGAVKSLAHPILHEVALEPVLDVAELPGGMVVSGVDGMAREINRLLEDPTARAALATVGRDTALRDYTWDAVVDQYEALYRR